MVLVILESGLLTRPFTLFSSQGLCKSPLYVIWVKKAAVMNGFQDDENRLWQFLEGKKARRYLGGPVSVFRRAVCGCPGIFLTKSS